MSSRLDTIERQVQKEIGSLCPDARENEWNDTEWTHYLKDRVGKVGRDLGFNVFGTNIQDGTRGEWLFDLVWAELVEGHLMDVILVMESEWSTSQGETLYDFQKLLVARATHRVMVCSERDSDRPGSVVDDLIEEARSSKLTRPGDRFLFAVWRTRDWAFDFRLFVKGDGE